MTSPHLPQERLRRARVLIVGVGGLGAPAAMQLAGAGIGELGVIDGDRVELSNLPRQILYRTSDVGSLKVAIAAERLPRLYPHLRLRFFAGRLTADNVDHVFQGFDFILDGTDDPPTKYLINDRAVSMGIPFSHAGVIGLRGQTFTVKPRRSACLRCLFPAPPGDELPTCQTAGILAPVAGTIATLQAMEAVKLILGSGDLLTDRLLTYDGARLRWRSVRISRNPACAACGEGNARVPAPSSRAAPA
jgi:adenylyltransferase/sulfurtransferase